MNTKFKTQVHVGIRTASSNSNKVAVMEQPVIFCPPAICVGTFHGDPPPSIPPGTFHESDPGCGGNCGEGGRECDGDCNG